MIAEPDLRPLADALSGPGFLHLPAPGLQALLGWTAQQWAAFAATWEIWARMAIWPTAGAIAAAAMPLLACRASRPTASPTSPITSRATTTPQRRGPALVRTHGARRGRQPHSGEHVPDAVPLFAALDGHDGTDWHSEVHQFRIETSPAEIGRPTPEGFHRDGVDWVLVMLIGRRNVAEGTTEIADLDGKPLGRFTLGAPGDAVLLNDRRILHGVTPVLPLDGAGLACRDALVVTWRAGV
jgi:hypothetical protein